MAGENESALIGKIAAHNTKQLKDFFEGSTVAGDWQLVFAASYNGCIISLPAEGGGQMRLRIAARYGEGQPYLELLTQRMGKPRDDAD